MPCLGIWMALAGLNLATFLLAVADKAQARRAGRRVPERVLLAGAWLGGWPGLLLAFVLVRHKTRKAAFLAPFFLAVLGNALAGLFLLRLLGCLAGWPA